MRLLLITLLFGCSEGGGDGGPRDMSLATGGDLSVRGDTDCVPGLPERLSTLPGRHGGPRLTFTGTGYVAAWNTLLQGGGLNTHRIDVSLVDSEGQRLGPNLPMSTSPVADPSAPSIVSLRNGTVVAWSRITEQGTRITLNILDPNGQKLDPIGQPCDPSQIDCGHFGVVTSGNARQPALGRPTIDRRTAGPLDSLVGIAWIGTRDICDVNGCVQVADVYWKKIQSNGIDVLPETRLTAAPGRYALPRMAFDGSHYGIVWRDDSQLMASDFYFATLDEMGQVAAAPGRVGSASGSFVALGTPDLVWSDSDYALATTTGDDTGASVVLSRFGRNGATVLPARGVTFGGVACTPALAWDGKHFAVAWQTACGQPGSALAFELLDRDGVRLRPDGTSCGDSLDPDCGVVKLSETAGSIAASPDLVWAGGGRFGVSWAQYEPGDAGTNSEIYFMRVDCGP